MHLGVYHHDLGRHLFTGATCHGRQRADVFRGPAFCRGGHCGRFLFLAHLARPDAVRAEGRNIYRRSDHVRLWVVDHRPANHPQQPIGFYHRFVCALRAVAAMAGAEQALGGALGKLMAIAEAYPDLKANQNFGQLQTELSDTENKIQAARRFYNGNVRDLAIKLQSFPSNVIGNMFGFKEMDLFELEEGSEEREVVKVDF